MYNQHLSEINTDPIDLTGLAVDNLAVDNFKEVNDNDSDDQDDDVAQEVYKPRLDWMMLSEMMPGRQTRNLADFSTREIMIGKFHSNVN